MGVNQSRTQNIKLVKRGGVPTIGKTASSIRTASDELDPINILRRSCREMLKKKSEAFYHYPYSRTGALADIKSFLDRKLFPTDLWDKNKIAFSLEPGKADHYSEENHFSFHCWEKNNKNAIVVEGTVRSIRGNYDYATRKGYPFTYEFEKLNPVSPEGKAKLQNKKKQKTPIDPLKVITPQELQQLTDLDNRIAAGGTTMLPGSYRVRNSPWHADDRLLDYLRASIFTDPHSKWQISMKHIGNEPDGSLRYSVHRTYNKKTTYREMILTLKEDSISGSMNHFHITKVEKAAPKKP